jgi:hypothetical protein
MVDFTVFKFLDSFTEPFYFSYPEAYFDHQIIKNPIVEFKKSKGVKLNI